MSHPLPLITTFNAVSAVLIYFQSNKTFTHQVSKLDGGEPRLDDWPQAPEEVGRQGEPTFKTHEHLTSMH